ncbi:unnamed protein product, partial [Meganyctiphanes norvegica]
EGNKELPNIEIKSSQDIISLRSGHVLEILDTSYGGLSGNDLHEKRESKAINEDLKSKIEAAVISGIQTTQLPVSDRRSSEATSRGLKDWFKKDKGSGGSGGESGQATHRVYLTGSNVENRYQYAGTGGSAVKSPPRLVIARDKSTGAYYKPLPEIVLNGDGPNYQSSDGTIIFESV